MNPFATFVALLFANYPSDTKQQMLQKTEGLVLSITPYSDKYAIARIFTPDYGATPYIIPRKSGKTAKMKASFFYPLSLLDLEVEHLPNRDIQRIKSAEITHPLYHIQTDMTKTSLAFFLSEFLSKVLRETHDNHLLFAYLKHSLLYLESTERGLGNFHIVFMTHLTSLLGIEPDLRTFQKGYWFDMIDAEFVFHHPTHNHVLTPQECMFLSTLSRIHFRNMHCLKLTRTQRQVILDYLMQYYRIHVYDFPSLKSWDVLRELF